ncbi:hypothetical protein MEO93_26195, partial [Dolichospermum sp. ST_sed3]|nr:hypothetical protein [Dolichospermum sp. ST_sed3]MDD1449365.1 hypothetical protein [Dolichospermum sp. ST_sed8]
FITARVASLSALKGLSFPHTARSYEKEWPAFEKRLWQRNYHEHIIRNEKSCDRLREYIRDNPILWDVDTLHPNNPENFPT